MLTNDAALALDAVELAESVGRDLLEALDRGAHAPITDLVREQTEERLAKLRAIPAKLRGTA